MLSLHSYGKSSCYFIKRNARRPWLTLSKNLQFASRPWPALSKLLQFVSRCWLAHSKPKFKQDVSVDCQVCFHRQIQTKVPKETTAKFVNIWLSNAISNINLQTTNNFQQGFASHFNNGCFCKFIVNSVSEGAQNPSSMLIVGCRYSKILLYFCGNCTIFCEGEWEHLAFSQNMASGPAFGKNFASCAASGHNMASGQAFWPKLGLWAGVWPQICLRLGLWPKLCLWRSL